MPNIFSNPGDRNNLGQLIAQRGALRMARYQGVLTVRAGDKWVTYRSDKEMRNALNDLNREIAKFQGNPRPKRLYTYAQKGL